MADIKLGYGCGIKATLLMPTGVVCDLRDALFVNAVLVLPNGSTMYAKDISADNVTNAIYVRLLADRELTTEGNYSILFNVKLVDGVMYSTVAVNFANVTTNADAEYKEIVLSSNLEVTDNPHNVQRTGASPKVSTRQTWLVYNDEAKAYEDTGIPAEVNLGDYYTKEETDEKVAELESEENRNRIYLEDIDAVIADLPISTTTWLSTFPIVLNAGDVVHITPMLSGILSLDGVYLNYSDGTRKAIYTWGSGKLKVVNIDKKVTSVGFYYSAGTPTTDYIRFHYMGKAALLAEIEPRISSLETAESRLSANQQAIQTDIAAIENTANIVTISELTEGELVQLSSIRIICDRLISAKRIVGTITTSVIDIAVQYMDINSNILYDSGWTRSTEINTAGYTNAHTLRLTFRNQSATSISKEDVLSHISELSLKEYGSLLQKSDIVGEGNTEYYGKAITLNILEEKRFCNNLLLHTIYNREDITALTSIQSLAIHDGVAIIPKDGTRFVIMDIASGELIHHGEFPQSHHNNAIQFSNTFYDTADRFPLLLLSSGDYENPSNKAMVLRMSNDYNMTLIKEIHCSLANVQYNGSFVADFSTNRLWLYTFTNGSYAVRENNNVVIYEFALPNIKASESVMLSKDDILKETILPICTMQDAVAYGGKLWFPCSYADYINGFPTSEQGMNDNIILVLNPNNGVIESAIKEVSGLEPQGIDFYNGKMYYACKNSGITEIGKTAFRFYEYSFN